MIILADPATSSGGGVFIYAIGALLSAIGFSALLKMGVNRLFARRDKINADHAQVAEINAGSNRDTLELLLTQMDKRIESYEQVMRDMKSAHAADIADLKRENVSLTRKVAELQVKVNDYALGLIVPRGQVLVPLIDIRSVRHNTPAALPQSFYPGEDAGRDNNNTPGSVVARITPVNPQPGDNDDRR